MEMLSAVALLESCSRNWEEQRLLCDELERIADSLPDNIDRQACIYAARALPSMMARAHRFEEEILYPALGMLKEYDFDTSSILDRLRIEHAGDECFAEELSEVLMSYGRGEPLHNAEATGYMLRGFFEALRRHVATEEDLTAMLRRKIKDSPEENAEYLPANSNVAAAN